MRKIHRCLSLVALLAVAGCGQPAAKKQVVRGQAALESFPETVTQVRAARGRSTVSLSGLSSDGSFSLSLPAGTRYELVFVGAGQVPLVFPRSSGSIDRSFDVQGAGKPFDLGSIRYVGDLSQQTFAFSHFGATSQASTDSSAAGEANCEDGVDTSTGAVCVDDDDEGAAAIACGGDSEADDDAVDCVDGIDAATGLECDGGPAANADDGADDEEAADENGTATGEGAVADHNLPSAMGCSAVDDNIDCEDGIDPATGLECDGGPAANKD